MKTNMSGKELVAEVTDKLGEKFNHPQWVELLYDILSARGESRVFNELALEAKSFIKLLRLVKLAELTEGDVKEKIDEEIRAIIWHFYHLLERASQGFQKSKKKEFETVFLDPGVDKFEKMIQLLGDFEKIKDYYLKKRDEKEKS